MPGFDGNIFNWCTADGLVDDTHKFCEALTAANAAGGALHIPQDANVYLPNKFVWAGDVILWGEGKITHTRDGGLHVKPAVIALGAITSFTNEVYPPNWNSAQTTKITLATVSQRLRRGQILLISSDDLIPETPRAMLGELARVQEVSGATVYLSGKLEFAYTLNPVAHVLSEHQVDISGITFQDPDYLTDNTGKTGSALAIEGVAYPRVTARFKDQANAALEFISCWEPYANTAVHNGRNNHTDQSYGYGVLLTSATAFGSIQAQGTNNRHLISGGASGLNGVTYKGAPRHNTIFNSLAIAPLSSGFDTHESMYHTRFVNCWVHKQIGNTDFATETTLYAFADRGAGTQFIDCGTVGAGGLSLYGASYDRQGSAGRYTTRIKGYTVDQDIINPGTPLRVATAKNATIASYHQVEVIGGTMCRTIITIEDGAPRTTFDGVLLLQQSWSITCGQGNQVTFRNIGRRNDAGPLSNIFVGPGTTLVVSNYTAEASGGWDRDTLIYATGGTGTATVKLGQIQVIGAPLNRFAESDGITTLSGSLLGAPLRPVAIGTSANRPSVSDFEVGQQYFDTTLKAGTGKPIWWNGTQWVDCGCTNVAQPD